MIQTYSTQLLAKVEGAIFFLAGVRRTKYLSLKKKFEIIYFTAFRKAKLFVAYSQSQSHEDKSRASPGDICN